MTFREGSATATVGDMQVNLGREVRESGGQLYLPQGAQAKIDQAIDHRIKGSYQPVRQAFAGANVAWDNATNTSTVRFGDYTVALEAGHATAKVNGQPVRLSGAPQVLDGQLYLPPDAKAVLTGAVAAAIEPQAPSPPWGNPLTGPSRPPTPSLLGPLSDQSSLPQMPPPTEQDGVWAELLGAPPTFIPFKVPPRPTPSFRLDRVGWSEHQPPPGHRMWLEGNAPYLNFGHLYDPPTLLESLVPVWGSGRMMLHHLHQGHVFRTLLWGGLALSDVFLVTSLLKLGVQGGRGLIRGAAAAAEADFKAAAKAAPLGGEVGHWTYRSVVEKLGSPEGIAAGPKLGSKWGVFVSAGIKSLGLPSSRQAVARLTVEGASPFARPPWYGPIGLARRATGAGSTALGSLSIEGAELMTEEGVMVLRGSVRREGFIPGEILTRRLFSPATSATFSPASRTRYLMQVSHQWLLDYGFDSGVYAAVKTKAWDYDLGAGGILPE